MRYIELKRAFELHEAECPKEHLTAHIVFTEDSFKLQYSVESRTYCVSSFNKAYLPNMGGYSIFSSCLDGTDPCVRLEQYMEAEGNKNGWEVENCYILEQMLDAEKVSQYERCVMEDEKVCFRFGGITIWAYESVSGNKTNLRPISGTVQGEDKEYPLDIDMVHGYCTLLVRHLNEQVSKEGNQ